jgi:hypothetical protein
LQRPLPDGIVPEEVVARTETHWLIVMGGMLVVMMAVVVATGVTNALHPPSNVETVDPTTLHLGGEFAESNLGTAVEPNGSVTVRLIAEQYAFVPDCRTGSGRYTGEIPHHQHRRHSRLPASRDEREHDGDAGFHRRSPHELQSTRRLQHAVP